MKRTLITLVAVLGLTVAAFAADITGKWTAEVQGRNGAQTMTMNLKADGATVTGTITTPRGDNPIQNGKLDGDNVSFTQHMEFNGNAVDVKYEGKVSGDTIKFTRAMGERTTEFTAKRVN